jgi:hypothetical protein
MCARLQGPATWTGLACAVALGFLLLRVESRRTNCVYAAQVQTVPSQQNMPPPPAASRPFSRQPGEALPGLPKLPGQRGNTREIPLPQVFRGCWTGSVPRVDSIEPLSSETGRIIWLTKLYTLCYKQTGYSGRWQLTFAESSVAQRHQVSDQRQSIQVTSVSGADRAQLTAYLHFRAPQLNGFGIPTGVINTVDELTHLDCYVLPGDDVMEVRAAVFVENDNRPEANVTWHTRLARAADRSD